MNEEEKNLNPANDQTPEVNGETVPPEVIADPEPVYEPAAPAAKPAAPAEKKKAKGKKPLIIAIAAIVIIAIVSIIASASSSPIALVGKGLSNSASALKQNDVVSFAEKTVKGGSIEVVCDMEELMKSPIDGVISMKLYTAAAKAAVTADVEIEGDTVLNASAFIDKENIAVASDILFGSKAYGVNLPKLVENFENSAFGPEGDFSLGIEIPDAVESITKDSSKMMKDSEAISKAMLNNLLNSIKNHTEISKANESLTVNGKDVKVTAVELQADGEALAAVVNDLVNYLRNDNDLKTYLYNYADYLSVAMLESGLVYGDLEDPEDIIDEFYDQLATLGEDEMEDFTEMLKDTDLDLSLIFYITKSGKELIGVKFDGDADGKELKASVIAGPSLKNIEEIAVRLDDGYSVYRITYAVETNDKKEYSAKLKVREDSENILVGEFVWDKSSGDFEIELTDDWGDTYGVEGKLMVDSKTAAIVLESVYDYYEEIDLGVSLTVSASDKMPAMPSYTEILTMSSDDLIDMVYDIEEIVYELSDIFYYY